MGCGLARAKFFCSEKVAYVEPNPSFFPYARENSQLQPLGATLLIHQHIILLSIKIIVSSDAVLRILTELPKIIVRFIIIIQ